MKSSAQDNIRSISGGVQFYVDIRYQQNSSWQGSIQRLDTGETIYFRSELEMLTLMQSAVQENQLLSDEKEKLRNWSKKPKEVEATGSQEPIPALK